MPVYEVAAGSALAQVEAFCRHLTNAGTFDTTTFPTAGQVNSYLDHGGYEIAGLLARSGYSTAQTDTEVLGFLQNMNAYHSVISVELSVPISGVSGEGNARFQEFKARYQSLRDLVQDSDLLEQLGATRSRSASAYLVATGISQDAKDDVNDDTDHIPARFRRNMHRFPGHIAGQVIAPGDLAER